MSTNRAKSPKSRLRQGVGKSGSHGEVLVSRIGSRKNVLHQSRSKYSLWEEKELEEKREQKMQEEVQVEVEEGPAAPRPPWVTAGGDDDNAPLPRLAQAPSDSLVHDTSTTHDRLPLRMARVDAFNAGVGPRSRQRRVRIAA